MLRSRQKARVVCGHAIAKCSIQSGFVTDTKEVWLEKRGGAPKAVARARGRDVACSLVTNEHVAQFNQRKRLGPPDSVARKQLCYRVAARAAHVERRNHISIDK